MSDPVLVAMIATVGTILGTGITSAVNLVQTHKNGKKIDQVKSDSSASRAQVENSHTTNLRVEQDERHAEIMQRFDLQDARSESQERQIVGLQKDVRGMRSDIGRLAEKDEKLDDRIHDLENK